MALWLAAIYAASLGPIAYFAGRGGIPLKTAFAISAPARALIPPAPPSPGHPTPLWYRHQVWLVELGFRHDREEAASD